MVLIQQGAGNFTLLETCCPPKLTYLPKRFLMHLKAWFGVVLIIHTNAEIFKGQSCKWCHVWFMFMFKVIFFIREQWFSLGYDMNINQQNYLESVSKLMQIFEVTFLNTFFGSTIYFFGFCYAFLHTLSPLTTSQARIHCLVFLSNRLGQSEL